MTGPFQLLLGVARKMIREELDGQDKPTFLHEHGIWAGMEMPFPEFDSKGLRLHSEQDYMEGTKASQIASEGRTEGDIDSLYADLGWNDDVHHFAAAPVVQKTPEQVEQEHAEYFRKRDEKEARDAAREKKYRARVKRGWEPSGQQQRFLDRRSWARSYNKEARSNLLNNYLSSLSMDELRTALRTKGEVLDVDALEIALSADKWVRELSSERGIDGAVRRAAEAAVMDFKEQKALEDTKKGQEWAEKSRVVREQRTLTNVEKYAAYIAKYPKATDAMAAADLKTSKSTIQRWKKYLPESA